MEFLEIIANKLKDNNYPDKIILHIARHAREFDRMVIEEGRLDDWMNSEMNLFIIYILTCGKDKDRNDIFDWKGMYERLRNHALKGESKIFNVQENGDIIQKKKVIQVI